MSVLDVTFVDPEAEITLFTDVRRVRFFTAFYKLKGRHRSPHWRKSVEIAFFTRIFTGVGMKTIRYDWEHFWFGWSMIWCLVPCKLFVIWQHFLTFLLVIWHSYTISSLKDMTVRRKTLAQQRIYWGICYYNRTQKVKLDFNTFVIAHSLRRCNPRAVALPLLTKNSS